MSFNNLTLVIPEKIDLERDAVAEAWKDGGGEVLRLGRFWDPPTLERHTVRVYDNDTFCLVLEQQLGLRLISPPDDLLVKIDRKWTKRSIIVRTLKEVLVARFPQFVKPLVPKLFRAAIYRSNAELQAECSGLDAQTPVLISDIVDFQAEARAFILNGKVKTCSVYEGTMPEEEAAVFASSFARTNQRILPSTSVIDIGFLGDGSWAIVEANATWGSGLNGCSAALAADCIAYATIPA